MLRDTVIHLKMALLILVCLSVLLNVHGVTTNCPTGHFFDRTTEECTRCSECPRNEIIRRTCTKHKDTVCGPFHEWHRDDETNPDNQRELVDINREDQEKARKDGRDSTPVTLPDSSETFRMVSTDGENHWKIVSFCLMAILALVLLSCTVFCVIKLSRRNHKEADDPVYLRTRIFSRDRLSSSDYVRYLSEMDVELGPHHDLRKKRLQRLFKPGKTVEFRDEVFDASDESIYKSVNNGKFRLPAIPEELFEREIASKVERAMSKIAKCNKADENVQSSVACKPCSCEGACACTEENRSLTADTPSSV